jgi:hypothetical protein
MSSAYGFSHLHRSVRSIATYKFLAIAVALMFACLTSDAYAQNQALQDRELRDIRSLNQTEKQALLKTIYKKLRYVLDHAKPYPGQAKYTPLSVHFETHQDNEWLVIDLGAANGPFSQSGDMSHFGSELIEPVTQMLDEVGISHPAFDFRFGGKDADYYDPGNPYDPGKRLERRRQEGGEPQAAIPPEGARVVVSAMHGYYWRERDGEWALQRPELSNGIYEDLITPEFVVPLGNNLAARSGATVHLPRSRSLDAHPRAGYPWWQMAGRYYLKGLYPDNPEIWDSLDTPLPDRGWNLIQYDEDIRSRPYFANYINADAILNLHTNASSNPAATGARAYVALNRLLKYPS